MAEEERKEARIVRPRDPPSTLVPNTIFAICMVAFIAFMFWQYGMSGTSPVDLSENARTAPAAAPDSSRN